MFIRGTPLLVETEAAFILRNQGWNVVVTHLCKTNLITSNLRAMIQKKLCCKRKQANIWSHLRRPSVCHSFIHTQLGSVLTMSILKIYCSIRKRLQMSCSLQNGRQEKWFNRDYSWTEKASLYCSAFMLKTH